MDTNHHSTKTVDTYIASFPEEVQVVLKKIRHTIKKAAPRAHERISYGMPFYEYGETGTRSRLIYFAAFKKHIGLFITPGDTEHIPPQMEQYHVSKATYQFPLHQPFPYDVLADTVQALVAARESVAHEDAIASCASALSPMEQSICASLAKIITTHLPKSESKIWHRHPVWFLEGNPIVGYSKQKVGIRLMFWSGRSFDEPCLIPGKGRFQDASIVYHRVSDIDEKLLSICLHKSISIQWDYKHIVKNKGVLYRLP